MEVNTDNIVVCEECGHESNVFPCDECDGTEFKLISTMLICPNCGREFYDWKCPKCGKENPYHRTVKKTA